MFDSADGPDQLVHLDEVDLQVITALLGSGPVPVDPAARIDRLEALERLKSAACAAQARITSAVVDAGEPSRSVGAQVGLARHESPHRGRRLTGLAVALVDDLPHTLAALERGDINEHRAQLVADGVAPGAPLGLPLVDELTAEVTTYASIGLFDGVAPDITTMVDPAVLAGVYDADGTVIWPSGG